MAYVWERRVVWGAGVSVSHVVIGVGVGLVNCVTWGVTQCDPAWPGARPVA